MPKGKGRQRKRIRTRQWDPTDADAVTRERRRVRGRESGIGAPVEVETRELDAFFTDIEPNGIVLSPYGALAFVECEGEEVLCRVADDLVMGKTSILAPGDRVQIKVGEDENLVEAVAPRRSHLTRPSIRHAGGQVFAANVDLLAIIIAAAKPAIKRGLIDRYLIVAEQGGVEPVLCVNKMDLVKAEPPEVALYRDMGLRVVTMSCESGDGLGELREILVGRLSILAGHSGVGKSTIVNSLAPDFDLATQEVSTSNEKGRHTTSASRLYHLPDGIDLIDTPGIRQLGLWEITPENLALFFADIAGHVPDCKFRDCTHIHEPNCAVRAAVEAGEIAQARYDSYIRIRDSLD